MARTTLVPVALVASMALAAAEAPALGGGGRAADDARAEVARVLREHRAGRPDDPRALRDRLAALGAAAVPHLFGGFANGRLPSTEAHPELVLAGPEAAAARAALLALPEEVLDAFMESFAERAPSAHERGRAIELVAERADGDDVCLLAALAAPAAEEARIAGAVRARLELALDGAMERDDRLVFLPQRAYEQAHPVVRETVVDAVARRVDVRRLRVLADLVSRDEALAVRILGEIGRFGRALPQPCPEEAGDAARRFLGDADPRVVLAAIDAVRRLGDAGSVEALVRLLDHRYDGVREAALGALRSLTGQRHGPRSDDWWTWYEPQADWWRDGSARDFHLVAHGPPERAAEAVMQLSHRRLHRHRVAPELARALERDERDLRLLSCTALGTLGSWTAVPALADALDDRDEAVRDAAHEALRRITGLDHERESPLWHELRVP